MLTLEQVSKISWYKQSGAGIPLCIGTPFLPLSGRLFKRLGLYFPNDIVIILKQPTGYIFYHYFDADLTLQEARKIFKFLEKDVKHFASYTETFYQAVKDVEKYGWQLLKLPLASQEFQQAFDLFWESVMSFWENSEYIDLLDPFESEMLEFIFATDLIKINKEQLNILMSPDELSNYQQMQQELLAVYNKFKVADQAKILAELEKLAGKYYWLKNDYEVTTYLDANHFLDEFNKLKDNPAEIQHIQMQMDNFQTNRLKKAALFKELKFNQTTCDRLNFFNWLSFFRDDRKRITMICNYILVELIKRISQEFAIDLELLKNAIPDELPRVIKKDTAMLAELKDRLVGGLIVFGYKEKPTERVSGETARQYFATMEKTISSSEIRGTSACRGKAIGTARVILNQQDFVKMQQGDILIASMTRPEYVPVMKMAKAVITDEGGITCHAAIITRELNIPCITGTQSATQLLHDGDLIEVDANHGLAKIIKKAE